MKIDANSRYVALAVNPSGDAVPLKVDSVTGYLLVNAVMASTSTTPDEQSVDDNSRDVATAENPTGGTFIVQTNSQGVLYTTTA